VYLRAVEGAFGSEIDCAMLVKTYESSQEEARYSPAVCTSCESKLVMGHPDPKHVSTSFVERPYLNMRLGMRRSTRLTNAFSKKVENPVCMVARYCTHYNSCSMHKTIGVTPATGAGVEDYVCGIEEIAALLPEPNLGPGGTLQKEKLEL
jgi:hypothetical protein